MEAKSCCKCGMVLHEPMLDQDEDERCWDCADYADPPSRGDLWDLLAELAEEAADECPAKAKALRLRAALDAGRPRTPGPYTIRTRDDLGSDGGTVLGEHLTLDEMRAWLNEHEDDGTLEIIDESDGRPACGDDTEMSGGAWGCDCGRPHG